MKANVLYHIGDLRYTDVALPELHDGEALVRVRACGICGSDVARVFTTGTYHFPTIIGHEFSGEVVETCSAADAEWVGRRVSVFPLIPCRHCDACHHGQYEMCTCYNYLGSRTDGGFAEYVAVPVWNLFRLPDSISYEEGAMMEPAAVAMHALKIACVGMGDTVAITGPGTIGMILAQLIQRIGGTKAVLIGRTQAKLDYARRIGIRHVCNSGTEHVADRVGQLTGGRGADIAIEGTGAGEPMNLCLNLVRSGGRIVAMGNPQGDMLFRKDAYWKLLRKQLTLRGTWNSTYGLGRDDWQDISALLAEGALNLQGLITHRLPLAELQQGLSLMRDATVYTNKVMIVDEQG